MVRLLCQEGGARAGRARGYLEQDLERTGGGGVYIKKVNGVEKYYYGAGGGFTGGSTKVDEYGMNCWGGGGGSFSADLDAKFDHIYVEFGYCKIKRIPFNLSKLT